MQIRHPGDLVRVRRQRWRIVDRRAHAACSELTLVGVGATNLGVQQRVLTPFDIVESVGRRTGLRHARSRVWARACRQWLVESAPPGSLKAGHRARIELRPHQLEPALAVARGLGCRVLLADGVGLGKTIQAALVTVELMARGAAARVLILAPAGLRDQWAGELAARFQLDAVVLDGAALRRRSASLARSANPWTTVPIAIASIDYVKQAHVLPLVALSRWDVVIVDEAHAVAGDTDRRRAVTRLAGRAPYVLLLSATPHSGDRQQFRELCGVGSTGDPLLVFRRTRHDVPLGIRRRIHQLPVATGAAERRMLSLLDAFGRAVRRAHRGDLRERWLGLAVLHKRALSSPFALHQSVGRRLEALAEGAPGAPPVGQLFLPLTDRDGEITTDDGAPAWPGALDLGNTARERSLLERLSAAALDASGESSKLSALVRLLRRTREPAIVFTEYRDTLEYVLTRLARRAAVLHGGLTRAERTSVVAEFTSGRQGLLLATDAAAEGLNLQERCRIVVNLELPWNPVRLEQRIGRVDRIGQRRTVHVFHLIAADSGEARLVAHLRSRIARARLDLGTADPLDGQDEVTLARVAIAGLRPEAARADAPDDALTGEAAVNQVSLARDASTEAARLETVRRLQHNPTGGSVPAPAAPAWARARRRTRQWLGRRALAVFRVSIEDGAGRRVESLVVPLAVDPVATWPRSSKLLEAALEGRSDDVTDLLQRATADWQARAAEAQRAFTRAAIDRTRRIALAAQPAGSSFQPELFSRRAERERERESDWARGIETDAADRLACLEAMASVRSGPFELLLVLLP